MRTNIIIDDELMQKAMAASGLRTKRAVVEAGLHLLIDIQGQAEIRKLRGKVKWEGNLREMRMGRIAEDTADYTVTKE
jgi:Arc/MetJ family transcription regulator